MKINYKTNIVAIPNRRENWWFTEIFIVTFCEAKLPKTVAFSLAVTAILDAPSDNKFQPCKMKKKI